MAPGKLATLTISILTILTSGWWQPDESTFMNPIVESGADPWVIQWQGEYLYCYSRNNQIWVKRAARLTEIGEGRGVSVWSPPSGQPYSKELWAPELHYLQGHWYLYVAADDGDNFNHRMYVLEGTTQDPQDPFVLKGKISDDTDRWAIDGTVLETENGLLYFIWSGWEGTENVQQNLYIAKMSDPWTISGRRVCISRPELPWERNGRPLINEGPEVLKRQNRVFIIYSASGSWTDDYCLGLLELQGSEVLNPDSWVKTPEPVFSKTDRVFGPGHASFVRSPDGTENWIVYHSAKSSGAGWDRKVNTQKFFWRADGMPDFKTPIPPGIPMPLPSENTDSGARASTALDFGQ